MELETRFTGRILRAVRIDRSTLPWLIALAALLFVLLLSGYGYWRSAGVGPQVQVPMFYDAHYLYPRPWTQAQAAPGVPPAAPLAFYGPNQVSQTFRSGTDNLALLEVWLAGPPETAVDVSLTDESGTVYRGQIALTRGLEGSSYRLRLPSIGDARARTWRLTLAAPDATVSQPVLTRAVGGDRLGAALRVNEFPRPGNLALFTYARGLPGAWWPAAIAEQLLPQIFRLRLQQYKPEPFKGNLFEILLLSTAVLSAVYLVLAAPRATFSRRTLQRTLGWSVVGVVTLFLLWQLGSGRLRLPIFTQTVTLAPAADPLPVAQTTASEERLIYDLPSLLWTARREPEARFISTGMRAGKSALAVPGNSRLSFVIVVPPNGRLRAGFTPLGEGRLMARVLLDDAVIAVVEATSATPAQFDVDLSPWAGQSATLQLETQVMEGAPGGVWLLPQLSVRTDWLLPDPPPEATILPTAVRFADSVALVGYTAAPDAPQPGDILTATLYWRALQPIDAQGVVFVHLLDGDGNLIAQQDALPFNGAYPLPAWQPGAIIATTHMLRLPDDAPPGPYSLAIGIYTPDTLVRWSAAGAAELISDDRVFVPLPSIQSAAPGIAWRAA